MYFYANAPSVFKFENLALDTKKVVLFILDKDMNLIGSMVKEPFRQKVSFDIQAFLKVLLRQEERPLEITNTQGIVVRSTFTVKENYLSCIPFRIASQVDDGLRTEDFNLYFALNAYSKYDRPFQQNETVNCKFLSLLPAKVYKDFPFSLTVLASFSGNTAKTNYITTKQGTFLVKDPLQIARRMVDSRGERPLITLRTPASQNSVLVTSSLRSLSLPTYRGVYEIELSGQEEFVTIQDSLDAYTKTHTRKVEYLDCEDYSKAVYLKWINRNGGVEYYMFSLTHKDEVKKESLTVLKQYKDDGYTLEQISLLPTFKHTKQIATKHIDKEEYTALKSLFFSDFVLFWDVELREWIRCFVDNSSLVEYSTQTRIQAEFTIITE